MSVTVAWGPPGQFHRPQRHSVAGSPVMSAPHSTPTRHDAKE